MEFLARILAAHGGIDRWNAAASLTATVSAGGAFWGSVGLIEDHEPHKATMWLHEQRATVQPAKGGARCAFDTNRIALERDDGALIAEVKDPRGRYETARMVPWSPLHRAFFNGYALWTCLTIPFLLAMPSVEVTEQEPWREGAQIWRVIRARFPMSMMTLGRVQDFFFGDDLLLRRHDYALGSAGDFHCAQLTMSYLEAAGLRLPGQRRAYRRGPDRAPYAAPIMISLDVAELSFTNADPGAHPFDHAI